MRERRGICEDKICNRGSCSLFAVAENYPDLKANANFLKLQDELSETEDKITYWIDNCLYQVQRIYGTREHEIIKLN